MYCDSIPDGLVALGVFDGSLGIISLVLTLILQGTQEKIYSLLCTLAEFQWIWLTIALIYRKLSVGFACSVKEVLMLPDYQFTRYVAGILAMSQFILTVCLLHSDDVHKFTGEMLALALLVPVFSFCKGIALILVLLHEIYQIFSGKERNHIFRLIQDVQSKKQVIFSGILFLIIVFVYYILKTAFLFKIYNTFEDLNTQIFSISVAIQSIFLIIFAGYMTLQLRTLLREIPTQEDPHLMNPNQKCFRNWFILIKSIFFSEKMRWFRRITYVFWIIQSIYGLVQFPFFNLLQVTEKQLFTETSYLYFDTFLLQGLLISQIILNQAKKMHQIEDDEDAFLFNIHFTEQETSRNEKNGKQAQSVPNEQDLTQSQQQQQCGICLEDLKVGQIRQRLTCHYTHVFHMLCLQKWTQTQNVCPICRSPCE